MSKDFYSAIKERRSIYGISKEATVSDERIQEVIDQAVKYTPSWFNLKIGKNSPTSKVRWIAEISTCIYSAI